MANITSKMSDIITDQVKNYFGNSTLESTQYQEVEQILFYSRMSLILVANADFRLLIKVHCNECDVKSLAKEALQFVEHDLQSGLGDFIKELTNLLGGALKRSLEASQIEIGLSLPLLIRGFDELFSEKKASSESSYFSLGSSGQKIIVHVQLDFLNEKARQILANVNFSADANSAGGFEFL
ncbi:MAG: hypothetical protein WA160_11330 [Pseudobdellovibrio sp.]